MISRSLFRARSLYSTNGVQRQVQRQFSVIAVHSSFPASLLRYNPRQRSSLFDLKKLHEREVDPMDDSIEVSENGLVHPFVTGRLPCSNGASLMPNTFMMQEIIRTCFDHYIDDKEDGKDVETPFVYRIPKGTPIPSNLILFHEHIARFSLQPSHPISIEELNKSLDEFYAKYAEKKTAEQWLNENEFSDAIADDAVATWMAE